MSDFSVYERGVYPTVIFLTLVLILMLLFVLSFLIQEKYGLFVLNTLFSIFTVYQIKRHLAFCRIAKIPLVEFSDSGINFRNKRKKDVISISYERISSFRREYYGNGYVFVIKLKSGEEIGFGQWFQKKDAQKILNGFLANMPNLKPKWGWTSSSYAEYA